MLLGGVGRKLLLARNVAKETSCVCTQYAITSGSVDSGDGETGLSFGVFVHYEILWAGGDKVHATYRQHFVSVYVTPPK